MIGRELVLTVLGDPAGKGSLKCVGRPGGQHRLVEDNPLTEKWRAAVAQAAAVAWTVEEYPDPYQPVGVEITTTIARPAMHYGTGRNAGRVKPSAPIHPTKQVRTGTADVDKFARLILDALVDAGALADDAQVVECLTRKAYPGEGFTPDSLASPGVRIRLYPYDPWVVPPDPWDRGEDA